MFNTLTLIDLFDIASHQTDPERDYTFVDGTNASFLSFHELRQRAEQTVALLQQIGVSKGDTVLLVILTGVEFVQIYWALQLCRAVPCVLPSPSGTGDESQGVRRIYDVGIHMWGARLLITTANDAERWPTQERPFTVISGHELIQDTGQSATRPVWQPVPMAPDDVALIQATSGSTRTQNVLC